MLGHVDAVHLLFLVRNDSSWLRVTLIHGHHLVNGACDAACTRRAAASSSSLVIAVERYLLSELHVCLYACV
jgi:hypothetical protein